MRLHIDIYTDGGADPNPGPGGWGAVLVRPDGERELSGSAAHTTNNRMELTAVIEALRALDRPHEIDLYTDSTYVQKGITEWIDKWVAKDWENVANAELWQTLHAWVQQHHIAWHWVKGHAGNTHNERADALASAAIPRAEQPADPDAARVYLRIAGPKRGRGAGGWAAGVLRGDTIQTLSGRVADTTANRLLIQAALAVLERLSADERVQIFTNNSYLYDGITRWVNGWRASGWVKRTDGRPVKYREDWERLDALSRARGAVWARLREEMPEAAGDLKALAEAARES